MNRRELLKHFSALAVAPLVVERTLRQSAFAVQQARLSARTRRTLATLAETMLPRGKEIPGANGLVIVRLVEERLSANRAGFSFYTHGIRRLDHFARKMTRRSFAELSPSKRNEVLTSFWESSKNTRSARNKQAINFLEIVKQDALNEVFTTKAGLKWLGYKGNVHLHTPFNGCPKKG